MLIHLTCTIAKYKDPNVPSSLLKFWLRDLASPVIPSEYYNACIAVGGEEGTDSTAIKAKEIVESLPTINKAILSYMIRFLRVGDIVFLLFSSCLSTHNAYAPCAIISV